MERLTQRVGNEIYVECGDKVDITKKGIIDLLKTKLAFYEDAEEQGRLVVLDRETALAIAAGRRAIRMTRKRFHGAIYVYDPLGKDGGPYEIPYVKAGEILCNIWNKYPLDGEEAEKALEKMNNG